VTVGALFRIFDDAARNEPQPSGESITITFALNRTPTTSAQMMERRRCNDTTARTDHIRDASRCRYANSRRVVQARTRRESFVEPGFSGRLRDRWCAVFPGEPANNGWESPSKLGITSTRVEVFCDEPDALIARALEAGAAGSLDDIQDHQAPWGTHRQGHFTDPFGHLWLVGDRSPLSGYPR
jgi:hypothetical protein